MSKARNTKPGIALVLDDCHYSRVYRTSSSTSGYVAVTTKADADLSESQILFLGCSITSAHDTYRPYSYRHTFMKIPMPLPRTLSIQSQDPTAVRVYQIPFAFVVPGSLSLSACSHGGADAVRDEHLCPPPSMISWDKYDFSSNIARVIYSIQPKSTYSTMKAPCWTFLNK